jgi:hypothetical protein
MAGLGTLAPAIQVRILARLPIPFNNYKYFSKNLPTLFIKPRVVSALTTCKTFLLC